MTSPDLEQLLRWVRSGGTFEVLSRRAGAVDVALLTCSRDEEMARLRSDDAELIAYVDESPSSGEDTGPADR